MKTVPFCFSLAAALCTVAVLSGPARADIVLENARFSLALSPNGAAKSLVVKSTGEECLVAGERLAFCQAVQDRPFGNEVKLIWPNKRSVYSANAVERRADGALVFGFETLSDSHD